MGRGGLLLLNPVSIYMLPNSDGVVTRSGDKALDGTPVIENGSESAERGPRHRVTAKVVVENEGANPSSHFKYCNL